MAAGARESRRALALDVRMTVWHDKRFDAAKFIRTGHVVDWGQYGVPDTPAMREAKEAVKREREMHRKAGRG
jgi:hypothetical protein